MRETVVPAGMPAGLAPYELVNPKGRAGLLLVCDHASRALPAEYGTLGLDADAFAQHIAWDIGARAAAVELAHALDAPLAACGFSRLLIDPNRGPDDPTRIAAISDRLVIPGNRDLDAREIARREAYYDAYHAAIRREIDRLEERGPAPAILSIHSFTPSFHGRPRPWEIGILWDRDPRLAVPLIEALRRERDLTVGDNEPYSGALEGDTMHRHGTLRGLPHALVEIRQDLVTGEAGARRWARRLVPVIAETLEALLRTRQS